MSDTVGFISDLPTQLVAAFRATLEEVLEADLLVHDETKDSTNLAYIISRLDYPEFPVPIGVLRAVDKSTYDGCDWP